MSETLADRILAVLAQIVPETATTEIDPQVNFRDQVELDSVDFLGFVIALGRELGDEIPETDYPKLSSLAGCLEYLQSRAATAP